MPMLLNPRMDIQVIHDVTLGGKTFRPRDNPRAQAIDSDCHSWDISYPTDDDGCTVEWNELEQKKKDGLISFELPDKCAKLLLG